jgi:hypothetical protein
MPKKPPKTFSADLHFRIPQKLYQEIESAATKEDRTISNMLRVLLQEALKRRKGEK